MEILRSGLSQIIKSKKTNTVIPTEQENQRQALMLSIGADEGLTDTNKRQKLEKL